MHVSAVPCSDLAKISDKFLLPFFFNQIISKATTDGTLYTRDWDTEPLFPLPNEEMLHKEYVLSLSSPTSPLKRKNIKLV